MNGVSVYLGSQRGKESLIERILFAYAFFVLKQEWYTLALRTFEITPALGAETTRSGL